MSMNTMTSTGFRARPASARAVMIGALLTMYLPGSAMADTIYTYTGEDYTVCGGIYCSGGPFALSVTFETTLTDIALANLPFTDISDTVTSFTFTDGTGLRRDNINTPPGQFEFSIATDASGAIVSWFVGAYSFPATTQMQSNWMSPFGFIPGADFSETTPGFAGDFGFIFNNPGTWSKTRVPEPTTFALLAAGLAIGRFLRVR